MMFDAKMGQTARKMSLKIGAFKGIRSLDEGYVQHRIQSMHQDMMKAMCSTVFRVCIKT